MAIVLKDRVKQSASAPGTGTITLGSTPTGFQAFSAVGNGNVTYFAIVDPASGDWEVNYGTYTSSGTTLTRNSTPLSSSNSGSLVNFTGAVDVFVTYPSENAVWTDTSGVVNAASYGAITATSAALTTGTVSTTPASNTDIANKQYVDGLVTQGISYHEPVYVESPNTTGNLNATYNNGASGVGATLTNAGTQVALTVDGVLMTVGKRVLIYNQTNQTENGVYTVTTVGNGSTNWVLTRATDADTYGLRDPNALGYNDAFFVTNGDTGAGETYVCTTSGVITFGTTAITFAQISSAQVYNAGTGLTLTNTTFSITPTGTAGTYGSASQVPVFVTNASGQVTSATNTNIAINGSQVSGNISGSAGSVANALTLGTYLTGTSFNGSAAVTATVDATSANTASKVVARDASGDFSAGTITAALSGNATTATTSTNLAGGVANQLAYQSSANTTAFATAPSATGDLLNWNGSSFAWTQTPSITSITLSGGTANGVTYLNGSKVLTSGSALTFDGTNLSNSGNYVSSAANGRFVKSDTTGRSIFTGGTTGGTTNGAYIITEGYDYGGTAAGGAINLVTAGASSPISLFINGTEGMRLTSTGLGIGTSSPTVALDIVGTSGTEQFRIGNTTGGTDFGITVTENGTAVINSAEGATGRGIQFQSGGTNTMLIDSAGNVGIGTSSPLAKLNVVTTGGKSTIAIGDTALSTYSQLLMYGGSGKYNWSLGAQYNVNNAFEITPSTTAGGTTFSTPAFVIDTASNVGLGTSSPSSYGKLAVFSGSTANTAFFDCTAASAYSSGSSFSGSTLTLRTGANATGNATAIRFASNVNGVLEGLFGYVQNASTYGDFVWQGYNGSYSERMRLDSAGNLGLGRTPVAYGTFRVLDVAGSAGAIQKWVHTGSTVELQAYASSGLTAVGSATNHPLLFTTNDTERARIDSSGNLLVGGTAARGTTVGTKHLDLFDGTAPAGTLTNGVSVYSSSGDLKFMDAAGNAYDVGFRNIPQNAQTGSYTLVLSDSGKHIYHAVGAGAATYTIPANSSVAYPIGTALSFVNLSATSISIAITTDTMYLGGTGTTGTRTLANYGTATALKVTSTVWIITGSGLT